MLGYTYAVTYGMKCWCHYLFTRAPVERGMAAVAERRLWAPVERKPAWCFSIVPGQNGSSRSVRDCALGAHLSRHWLPTCPSHLPSPKKRTPAEWHLDWRFPSIPHSVSDTDTHTHKSFPIFHRPIYSAKLATPILSIAIGNDEFHRNTGSPTLLAVP